MKRDRKSSESPPSNQEDDLWYKKLIPWKWSWSFITGTDRKSSKEVISTTERSDSSEECRLIESFTKQEKPLSKSSIPIQNDTFIPSKQLGFKSPSLSNFQTPAKKLLFQNIIDNTSSSRNSWIQSTTRTPSPFSSRNTLNNVKTRRLSSVRKQQTRKQFIVMDKLKRQFNPSYKLAASSGILSHNLGYTGTQQDYDGLVDYMKKCQEFVSKTEDVSELEKSNHQTIQTAPYPVDPKAMSDQIGELLWIADLRKSIEKALKGQIVSEEPEKVQDSKFQELLEKEKLIDKQIELIQAPKKTAKNLFPPLSKQDLYRVHNSWTGEGVLVDRYNVALEKKDLRTLSGRSWLNDEVINFYGEMCMERAEKNPDKFPKIHVFSTFFYEQLSNKGFVAVKRWTKRRKIDIFSKDYVIIPVHMGMHWCCAVIDFRQKKIIYYDSLHGNNAKCHRLLKDYLEQESQDKRNIPFDTSDWQNDTPKNIPAQENGFDCGVFTCMFMEFTARGEEFLFRQEHMPYLRTRISLEILNCKLMAE